MLAVSPAFFLCIIYCPPSLFTHLFSALLSSKASLVAQLVNNPPAMQDILVWFLGWEDPLEKGWATYSSVLGLPLWLSWQRICLQCGRPGFDLWVGKIPWRRGRLPTPVFLPRQCHELYRVSKSQTQTEQLSLSVFTFVALCMRL